MIYRNALLRLLVCAAVIFFSSAVLPAVFTLSTSEAVSVSPADLVTLEPAEDNTAVPANVRLDRLCINSELARPLDSARVTSVFGYRANPVTGEDKFHTGIDLASPEGTHIYSVLPGTVSFAGWDDGYGNYIIVDHTSGLATLYAHCSQLLLKTGDTVTAGECIALVGSTGNSTGAHLHLEVRLGGARYDPACVVGDMYS